MTGLTCRVVLSHRDFIMANHRVHGSPVLPGVAFLDLVLRALAGAGEDPAAVVLRNVLFTEAVATAEGHDREVRCMVGPEVDGFRPVRAESRWLRQGEPGSAWRQHLRAELAAASRPVPEPIDVAGLRAGAGRTSDMGYLYERARRERIEHGPAMRCAGPVHLGDGYLLAQLALEVPDERHVGGFRLHPAMLDAATLAAFGQLPASGEHPFIPMFIREFRSAAPLPGTCYVHVPRPEVLAPSGDVITSDFALHDERGRFLAGCTGLSCKLIRSPELITRLVAGVAGPATVSAAPVAPVAETDPPARPGRAAAAVEPADPAGAARVAAHLRELVGRMLDRPADGIDTAAGFYELGLDSVGLLGLGRELERFVGQTLYPTLLFEFSTIDELAGHLAGTYQVAREATPVDGAGGAARATLLTDGWVPEDAPTRPAGELVLAAPAEFIPAVTARPDSPPLTPVRIGDKFAVDPDGGFQVDPGDPEQVRRLLAALRQAGRAIRDVALVVPAGPGDDPVPPCQALWTLAVALTADGGSAPARLTLAWPGDPASPVPAALAALARTMTAETPHLRCRVVTCTDPDGLAPVLLRAVADDSPEAELRLSGTGRLVRRWWPVTGTPGTPGTVLRDGGAYLLTGGSGGIATLLTDYLVRNYHARVMLVGASPAGDDLRERMRRWRQAGGEVRYVAADVSDAGQAARAAAAAREAFGTLHGVFHCAARRRDRVYLRKEAADFPAVLGPKALGAVHLDDATATDPLDFFVVFSSLSASVANPGQCDYAAANAYLDAFARHRDARPDRAGRSLAIAWPYWAAGGMRLAPDQVRQRVRDHGLVPLPTEVALQVLEQALGGGHPYLAVVYADPVAVRAVLPGPPPPPSAAAPPQRVVPGPALADGFAVIGVSGRYPQARDLGSFWRNLRDGRDCITEVPEERWDHARYFDPAKGRPGRTYGRWGGFLEGVDRFAPTFFGISRREAERMDPQERLFLSACWHALEDAGYPPESLSAETVGVFAGVMWNHYQLVADPDGGAAPTALHAAVPNRVSYTMDFTGPSLAVDTACSSSLTAVHLAVESIRRGECTVALAGGVNVTVHPEKYLQLAQGTWLSTDGRCRTFGKDGSGYVPGEGVGVIVLKPLSCARRDGDHIYAVIRASAINHGGRTGGVTVPSPVSQAELISTALQRAGWRPETVSYVEAHGTGTTLGDPIEVEGLRRALAGNGDGRCLIGSVKSNIGHLEGAAGIAGITKVLLQLRHRQVVASLHADELNPHIDLAATRFEVPREAVRWQPPAGVPRRAGVSGFGAGGANAHLLLEEDTQPAAERSYPGPWLWLLSARDEQSLQAYARRFVAHLRHAATELRWASTISRLAARLAGRVGVPADSVRPETTLGELGLAAGELADVCHAIGGPVAASGGLGLDSTVAEVAERWGPDSGVELADLTYTMQVGRSHMARRMAVVVRDREQLLAALDRYLDGAEPGGVDEFWGAATPDHSVPAPAELVAKFRQGELTDVAAAWAAGAEVPWPECYPEPATRPRRVPLPGYPLPEEPCWLGQWKSGGRGGTGTPDAPTEDGHDSTSDSFPPGGERAGAADPSAPAGTSLDVRKLAGGVTLLTMRGTTFTDELISALESAFTEIQRDEAVRAVVVTGSDSIFSMGGSAQALASLAAGEGSFSEARFLYEGMLRCDRPVVTAIQGHAAGGGLAFGLYADIVVIAAEGEYRANFLAYGFPPGMGATYILDRRMGPGLAGEMLLTGRAVTGDELARRGADVTVVARERVLAAALDLARAAADKPPAAIRALKTELARRVLAELTETVGRELDMHRQVLGPESARLVAERFGKLDHLPAVAGRASAPITVATQQAPPQSAAPAGVGAGDDDRAPVLSELRSGVTEVVGGVLYLEPHEVDAERSLADLGLDSVGAVEVVAQLNRRFGTDLDSVAVYDHPSVADLAGHVAEVLSRSAAIHAAAAAPPAPEPAPAPAAAGSVAPVTLPPLQPLAGGTAEPAGGTAEPAGDIAVIGMSGRFPGASNLEQFWENLTEGRCSITEVPEGRWGGDGYFHPDRRVPGRSYSKWAAMLPDVASFDAGFFQLSPVEAEAMDPQQRLFLQEAWRALEHAGYAGDGEGRRPWGVFVGAGTGDYTDLLSAGGQADTAHTFLGNACSVLAARIAYLLDLAGPAMAVDTACSSSLVAVDLAVASLRRGECDLALAGGVAVMCTPKMHIWTSKAGMLSPTGRCLPFDAAADGIVLGEGVGVVVLKPLAKALADGDHIHGVICGSGTNSDGRTNGITAPSATAQADLIARVQRQASVEPAEVGYVEAHGTGTTLGDPIEAKALAAVFGQRSSTQDPCRVGSVKGNIGHTTMAAGIAGLLKVLLALRHGQIPPSAGFETANPHLALDAALEIASEPYPWPAGPSGRRVGAVSSFGFSGTNCHVVVAEAPQRDRPAGADATGPVLVPVSALTFGALRHLAAQLADHLPGDRPLADTAATLALGRRHLPVRAAVVAADHAELRLALGRLASEGPARAASGDPPDAGRDQPASAPPEDPVPAVLAARGSGDPDRLRSALERVAAAYRDGHAVDWPALFPHRPVHRVPLPTYPFAATPHWVTPPAATPGATPGATPTVTPAVTPAVPVPDAPALGAADAAVPVAASPQVFVPGWEEIGPAAAGAGDGDGPGRVAVIGEQGDPLVPVLLRRAGGSQAVAVPEADLPVLWADPDRRFAAVYLVPPAAPAADATAVRRVFRVVSELVDNLRRQPLRLVIVLRGAVAVDDDELVRPGAAAVIGLASAIGAELPRWRVGCLDIGTGNLLDDPDAAHVVAGHILAEDGTRPLVALRGSRRLARRPVPVILPPPVRQVRPGGGYLVVGGAGGLGYAVSRHLAATASVRLAWIGRRPADDRIRRQITEISDLGSEAVYLTADAGDPSALRQAVEQARLHLDGLHGVVHAAGVLDDRALIRMTEEDLERVLRPKVAGSVALAEAIREDPLDFLLFFSSAVSFTAAAGQANYAAASTFQDAYAAAIRREGLPASVINWGFWGDVGVVATADYRQRFAELGITPISVAEGTAALGQLLGVDLPQVLVVNGTPEGLARLGIGTAGENPVAPRPGTDPLPAVRRYLVRIFSEVLKYAESDLDTRATFETFGVDSLLSLNIVDRLEQDLGELPSTLLFEHMTIDALAEFLLASHREPVSALLDGAGGRTGPDRADHGDDRADHGGSGQREHHVHLELAGADRIDDPGDIAVIGVVGRYPGAPELAAFWQRLAAGETCVTEVPPERWELAGADGIPTTGRGGFIDGVDQFDPEFFGILPRDAAAVDPQERLFLETAWCLLQESGYLGEHTREPATGVFVGTMYGSYGQVAAAGGWPAGRYTDGHSPYWSIANRVSYTLDLRGPSFAVDSACSSSLTAVHLAVESLRRGECRMAIAGGVNLILHPAHLAALGSMNMLAQDGACKVFDDRADGYVPGEGVGAVLLKPLARALTDGDDIWAVIKGSHVNAGGRTSGYPVPNPKAQAELVREAIVRAAVDPATISYVEAHGTGTALGDPIEIASLTSALRSVGAPSQCAVSSVKANLGHLEGAAGIAGLTRVLLQLRHRQLAPCANLRRVNPKIDFDGSPLYPVTELTDWPGPAPRHAGVSSFGAGGANAHVVVEEPPARSRPRLPDGCYPVLLSARTREQLRTYAGLVADHLSAGDEVTLAEVAYTSQVGRAELAERLAVLASTPAELVERLRQAAAGRTAPEVVWGGTGGTGRLLDGDDADPLTAPLVAGRQLSKLAGLWVNGVPVDWRACWPERPARVSLPPYPFARRRFWLPEPAAVAGATTGAAAAVATTHPAPEPGADRAGSPPPPVTVRLLRPAWTAEPLPPAPAQAAVPATALVLAPAPLDAALAGRLASQGTHCVTVLPGEGYAELGADRFQVDPARPDDFVRLATLLAEQGRLPDLLVQAAPLAGDQADPATVPAGLSSGPYPLLWATVAVLRAGASRTGLRVATGFPRPVGAVRPVLAAVPAMLRSLALEHSRLTAVSVAVDGAGESTDVVAPLMAEVDSRPGGQAAEDRVVEVRYAGAARWVRRMEPLAPADPEPVPVRPDGVYLIAGGAGALGQRLAAHLAGQAPATVVLAGRSALDQAARERLARLAGPQSRVVYEQVDLSDRGALATLVERVRESFGRLSGVIHAAGVTRDSRAVAKTEADAAAVLAPKVLGTVHLDDVTAGEPLDFFVLFSSVVARSGNLGQADYAYANAFQDEFAQVREQLRVSGQRRGRTVSIGWPLWKDGGMEVDEATRTLLARRWRSVPLPTGDGVRAFEQAVASDAICVMVLSEAAEPSGLVGFRPAASAASVPAGPAGGGAGAPGDPAADPRSAVESDLRGIAAGFLLVPEHHVDLDADLLDTGFDSISMTELVNQVNELYRLDLLPTVLFECLSLSGLVDYLLAHHRPEITLLTGAARAPAPISEATTATTTVAEVARPARTVSGPAPDASPAPVAVVGVAAVLPGSEDLARLWSHLAAGDDLIRPVPADRTDLLADPRTRHVQAGFLDGVRAFDADLFGVSPREASLMDPQHRLFLQCVWRAIEDAGYPPSAFAGSSTGLFAGVSACDYDDLLRAHHVPVQAHTASGVANCILANRVSHLLDLRGPSEAIDTACSSALVAVHRAVRAIRSGECEAALAGGVNLLLSPDLFVAFGDSGMLSADCRCRTFDERADGYARGEGVGAVLLKPLARARTDGDHVYAVVRGSAVNHGGHATSLTAPNPQAQARVLVAAHRDAGVDPRTVSYIEVHGTGTRLGDPIEVEGLKAAFQELGVDADQPPWIGLGSVKSNLGHLESAAGIAGLLKVLLCMRHEQLPPTIHVQQLNSHIRLAGTPFYINRQLRDWDGVPDPDTGRPVRRAGVSSFGFGGANAHVVLEAPAEPSAAPPDPPGPYPLLLSAPNAKALAGYAASLAVFLDNLPDELLPRLAYTLQAGREPLPHRLALLVDDAGQAAAALRRAVARDGVPGVYRGVAAPATRDGAGPYAAAGTAAWPEALTGWVDGRPVQWPLRWPEGMRRLAGVPSFPFADTEFWFPEVRERTVPAVEEVDLPEHDSDATPVESGPLPPRRVRLAPVRAAAGPAAAVPVAHPDAVPAAVPAAVTEPTAAGAVAGTIRQRLASIIETDPAALADDRPFSELGLDSIFRMELATQLRDELGVELRAEDVYEHDTVGRLAELIETRAGRPAPAGAETTAGATGELRHRLVGLVSDVLERPVDPGRTFTDDGFTSFDMLRTVSVLERRLGQLPKTLLFDHPTFAALADGLLGRFGPDVAQRLSPGPDPARSAAVPAAVPLPQPGEAGDPGPLLVVKRSLVDQPEIAEVIGDLHRLYGKEGGLAGRDIAPLALLGSARRGYFNVSIRAETLFGWSYVGPADYFPKLAAELVSCARARGLRPNFLSMLHLDQVADEPVTATPFGAVQRLEDLARFSIAGGRMSRLRYMVRRFERSGACRTVECRSGSDPAMDQQVAAMLDRWTGNKQMVNPYVSVVRDEILDGRLDERHRLFLTYLDDGLANVVIVTRIPSEPGYLLDLEFYPPGAPLGGLEYAIVQIIERLVAEGCTMFSFGASFGVRVCDSPNEAPEIAEGLSELRSVGVFGEGNFQFKNKFRPTSLPIYLCQPVGPDRTPVSEVILMIADPVSPPGPEAAGPVTAEPPPATPEPPALAGRYAEILARHHYNPLAVPPEEVEFDLATDSWAELDGEPIRHRLRLLDQSAARPETSAQARAPWLPFPTTAFTSSGRAAEQLLVRAWPGRRQAVVHNGLFPTFLTALAEGGFVPVPGARVATGGPFAGDLDLNRLSETLQRRSDVSLVVVELSTNAAGGYPVSLGNLRQVRELARQRQLSLVVDATRVLENATAIASYEEDHQGRDLWAVVHDLFAVADAVTMSLTKDFGVTAGGLIATGLPQLATAISDHIAARGHGIPLRDRRLAAAALADTEGTAGLVRCRTAAVNALWHALREADLPVVDPPGTHCVLLDAGRLARLAQHRQPVMSLLAWMFAAAGVRGAPHLGDTPELRSHIRLAVPLGLAPAAAAQAGTRLAALLGGSGAAPDLVAAGDPSRPVAMVFRPAAQVPDDVADALREEQRSLDDNAAVLAAYCPSVRRELVAVAGGEVEVFVAGSGPILVLMPPFNTGVGVFARLFEGLAGRYRVIGVHHPGVGATTGFDDITLEGIADLTRQALAGLGIGSPVHIGGASFGGLPALTFALRHSDACASLILLGSSYKIGNRIGEINRLAVVAREDFDAVLAGNGSTDLAAARADLERLLLRCESMDPRVGLRYLDVFADRPNLLHRLPEVAVPTLIVQGARDTVIPLKTAHLLHGSIADARYVELPAAGHFPFLTDPATVNRLLAEFMAEQDPVQSGAGATGGAR